MSIASVTRPRAGKISEPQRILRIVPREAPVPVPDVKPQPAAGLSSRTSWRYGGSTAAAWRGGRARRSRPSALAERPLSARRRGLAETVVRAGPA